MFEFLEFLLLLLEFRVVFVCFVLVHDEQSLGIGGLEFDVEKSMVQELMLLSSAGEINVELVDGVA